MVVIIGRFNGNEKDNVAMGSQACVHFGGEKEHSEQQLKRATTKSTEMIYLCVSNLLFWGTAMQMCGVVSIPGTVSVKRPAVAILMEQQLLTERC